MSVRSRLLKQRQRGARQLLPLLAAWLIVGTLPQCSVEKRRFTKGYYVQWHKNHPKTNRPVTTRQNSSQSAAAVSPAPLREVSPAEVYCDAKAAPLYAGVVSRTTQRLPPDSCGDKLLFRNGDELKVKVLEISGEEVKYRRCDNPEGPVYSSSTESLFSLTFANGLKRLFSPRLPVQPPAALPQMPKKVNGFALASFLCAIPFFMVFPLVLSFIFGLVALQQIKKEPQRYKGKWMAVVGVVLGSIAILFFLLLLTAILL